MVWVGGLTTTRRRSALLLLAAGWMGWIGGSRAIAQGLPIPAAPGDLYAIAEENNNDLFVDLLIVAWRAVRLPEVAGYAVKLSLQPDPKTSPILERAFPVEAGKAWQEGRIIVSIKSIYDYERIYASVEIKDRSGALHDYGTTSALFGERPSPRGDVDGNQTVDLTDAILLLTHLFLGSYTPSPYSLSYASDLDGLGGADITDAVLLLQWRFAGGPAPVEMDLKAGRHRVILGAFYGDSNIQPMYSRMDHVQAMEEWQGKKHALVNLFTNWSQQSGNDLFGIQLNKIWKNGNVPMITWEPRVSSQTEDNDIEKKVATTTQFDNYIRTWARRLKTWLSGPDGRFGGSMDPGAAEDDRRAYLRFAHEMNSWWSDWSAINDLSGAANTPDHYKQMWIKVHDILVLENGLDNGHLQWVWCVNNADADFRDGTVIFPAERYYPGDGYVDWIAIDGYNWGYSQDFSNSWEAPGGVFNGARAANNMLSRLKKLAPTKPICIAEYASTSVSGKNPEKLSADLKLQWITAAMNYFLTNRIKMALYFNLDKETDWAVFGGSLGRGDETFGTYQAYSAYRKAVRSDSFLSTDLDNPRLLTGEQFQGR